MRKNKLILYAIAMFAFLTCGAARGEIQGMAVMSGVSGDVQVQSGKSEWVAGSEGMLLRSGDKIKTGSNSSCSVKWNGGNTLKLQPFSALVVQKLTREPSSGVENTTMGLWSGRIYVKAKKLPGGGSSFDIRTPNAVAGIRGTVLSVGVIDQNTTEVEVLEGNVTVRGMTGGSVSVSAGQKTMVTGDSPPSAPAKLQTSEETGFEEIKSTPPELEVIEPVGDLETGSTPVAIIGRTAPGASVSVNGQSVQAGPDGTFRASVDLKEGTNQVRIESANKNGITTVKTRAIKYRPGAAEPFSLTAETAANPTPISGSVSGASSIRSAAKTGDGGLSLTVTAPINGLITRNASVAVTGSATPGARVTVNNTPVTTAPGSGAFSANVSLNEGENLIEIIAEKGGRLLSDTRSVTRDTTPPLLVVTNPAGSTFEPGMAGCTASGDIVTCSVIGQTEQNVSLTVNGAQCPVRTDGSFECVTTVVSGQSTIEIAAQDQAGNRSTIVLSRAYDRTKLSRIVVSVSPSSIKADMRSSAIVIVNTYNFLGEPVSATVSLSATTGGSLNVFSLTTTPDGAGTAVFTAGAGSVANTVTITATSGAYSGSTTLLLTPDVPPAPDTQP